MTPISTQKLVINSDKLPRFFDS